MKLITVNTRPDERGRGKWAHKCRRFVRVELFACRHRLAPIDVPVIVSGGIFEGGKHRCEYATFSPTVDLSYSVNGLSGFD